MAWGFESNSSLRGGVCKPGPGAPAAGGMWGNSWFNGSTISEHRWSPATVRAAGADAAINYGHDYAFLDE